MPVETIIATHQTAPKGYYSYVYGNWEDNTKIGDDVVWRKTNVAKAQSPVLLTVSKTGFFLHWGFSICAIN